MIISIATNDKNDMFLDAAGNLAMVTGIDAVKQDCEHAMKAQLGEMVLQMNDGIPYADTVFQRVNLAAFEAAARSALMKVRGVVQINSFAVAVTDGVLRYDTTIMTIYGQTNIVGFSASG